MSDFIFALTPITWLVIFVGGIIFFIYRRRLKMAASAAQGRNWQLLLGLSREDTASQLFLLLSVLFFGVTLLSFNTDLGRPLSRQTILLLTAAVAIASAYYFKVFFSLTAGLIGIAIWWMAQGIKWAESGNVRDIQLSAVLVGLVFIALIFYFLGHVHKSQEKFMRFGFIYMILGIVCITVVLFLFSSKLGLEILEETTKGIIFLRSWQMTVCLLLIMISLIATIAFAFSRKLVSGSEAVGAILFAMPFIAIAFLPEQSVLLKSTKSAGGVFSGLPLSAAGYLWAIIFNILVFLELLGLMLSGYLRQEEWLVNLGAFFLFLLILLKYFDWMFTFLDKSIFFIGAGILFFAVGWSMERGRRYMLSTMKTESQQIP